MFRGLAAAGIPFSAVNIFPLLTRCAGSSSALQQRRCYGARPAWKLSQHSDVDLPDSSANEEPDPWSTSDPKPHVPVMCKEVLECFWRLTSLAEHEPTFLDMTFGAGGHSTALLDTFPSCKVFAMDRDPLAMEYAQELSEKYPERVVPLLGKFSDLPSLMKQHRISKQFDGVLLDAGCSSMQMNQGERGFAFSKPESVLDMRMDSFRDPAQLSAAEVVNRMSEENLLQIFKKYGEEKHASRIARAIVESRFMMKQIQTTGDLADIVASVVGEYRTDSLNRKQHPATKIFQALRIFVNDELNELEFAMKSGHHILRPNGIFVAITFHSLECRIAKEEFHSADWRNKLLYDPKNPHIAHAYRNHTKWVSKEDLLNTMAYRWLRLHPKSITASDHEVKRNPRSRSAKLRAAMKLPT